VESPQQAPIVIGHSEDLQRIARPPDTSGAVTPKKEISFFKEMKKKQL